VLNLFEGKEGNVWALLNDGLDCVEVSSPMSALFEDASVYDVLIKDNTLLIATNLGVFRSSNPDGNNSQGLGTSNPNIHNIIGLEGQAWTLHHFEGQVLCSHDQGLYQISGDKIIPILKGVGIWKVIPVSGKPGYYLACAYEGIYLLTFDHASGFKIQHRLEGFNESSRDILQANEPGVFWICHGYKGVFRIKIEETFHRVVGLEHFKDKNGIPSPFNINVFRWNNEPVFTTNNGIFVFDATNKRFIPHTFLTGLFGTELNVRKLIQRDDKTWFIHDDEAGYFLNDEADAVLHKGIFRELKGTFNTSLECIYPINATQVLMGSNLGLHYFNLSSAVPDYHVSTVISNVIYKEGKDDITGSLSQDREHPFQFPHTISTITFHFSAPAVQQKTNVQYNYMLEGIDQDWSGWQESPMKEYSILRPGKYAFHVKAETRGGEQAEEAIYHFEILPVWYQTGLAMFGYFLLSLGAIVLIVFWVRRKIHRAQEKTRNEEQQKRNVLELIIERIKLERENTAIKKDKGQLEQDILHKSKELANHTNILIKKRELLGDLQEELKSLMEIVKNDPSRQKVRELIRRINIDQKDEEHIRVFESNFEKVHFEFFEELKAFFPDLTPKELQLCAFIKMNLGNKEIALIQNITVRGVETARYRIRKKLNLKPEEDLVDFFLKLHSAHQAASHETPIKTTEPSTAPEPKETSTQS
jgi:DNA-binding CsgD family transcriptional regulator